MTVNRLDPARVIKLKSKKIDGVKECREQLDALRKSIRLKYGIAVFPAADNLRMLLEI